MWFPPKNHMMLFNKNVLTSHEIHMVKNMMIKLRSEHISYFENYLVIQDLYQQSDGIIFKIRGEPFSDWSTFGVNLTM